MPTCILGMHRSGTSMVTHTLNVLDLYIGPATDLLTADSGKFGATEYDNPAGYWENIHFTSFNDELLECLGGTYLKVPEIVPGWSQSIQLDLMRHRAKGLFAEFAKHEHWGWKDPRNSLTLEFWQSLIPDLKIVLCIRNPLEIIDSLVPRNYDTEQDAAFSILTYYEILLQSLTQSTYIVTHYDSFFYDPQAEIRRLADFLELPVGENIIANAVEIISQDYHRNIRSHYLLKQESLPIELHQHYVAFCTEAGPVFDRMQQDDAYQQHILKRDLLHTHERLSHEIVSLQTKHSEVQQTHVTLQQTHNELQQTHNELQQTHNELQQTHNELQQTHNELQQTHNELQQTHNKLQRAYDELQRHHDRDQKTNEEIRRKVVLLEQTHEIELSYLVKKYEHELQSRDERIQEAEQHLVQVNTQLGESGELLTEIQLEMAELIAGSGEIPKRQVARENQPRHLTQGYPTSSMMQPEPAFISGRLIRGFYRTVLPSQLRLNLRDFRGKLTGRLRPTYHALVPLDTRLKIRNIRVHLIGR